jgi:hypothetical protein
MKISNKKILAILVRIGGFDQILESGGKIKKGMSVADANAVIDAFGGINELSRICNTSSASVAVWRKNGIPVWREIFLRHLSPEKFENLRHPHV